MAMTDDDFLEFEIRRKLRWQSEAVAPGVPTCWRNE
jgi:hypothetical protein